jgi:hypothetical protein
MTTRARQEMLDPVLNLFCVGQAHLFDGRLLTAGGHISLNSIGDPQAHRLHIYDPRRRRWSRPDARMRHHRWYPTVTSLPDGRVLITSGSSQALVANAGPAGTDPDFSAVVGYYAHLENNYEVFDPIANRFLRVPEGYEGRLVDLEGEPAFPVPSLTPPFVNSVLKRPLATYPAVVVLPGATRSSDPVILLQEANRGWLYKYRASGGRADLSRAGRKYVMPDVGSRSVGVQSVGLWAGFP